MVEIVRATRAHPDIRQGASVRAAIDLETLCRQLAVRRGTDADQPDVTRDASVAALSGRIRLFEGSGRLADDVVVELWQRVFGGTSRPPGGPAAGKDGAR